MLGPKEGLPTNYGARSGRRVDELTIAVEIARYTATDAIVGSPGTGGS